MKNYRSTGSRMVVTAAGARTSGQLVHEEGFVGVAETDAAIAARYAMRITGEFDVPFVGGAVKGNQVLVSTDGNNTVTVAARGTAVGAGVAYAGRVSAVPGNSNVGTTTAADEPLAGRMWIILGEAGPN